MNPLNLASFSISGCNLIEASAGTGKTWTIAALYILLLLEKELRPEQILVVTYTKAATAELRERIRRRIATTLDLYSSGRTQSDDALENLLLTTRLQDPDRAKKLLVRALYSFDDAAIFTIHGFCQRALLENTFESGSLFGSDMISDQNALVKEVCDDFWRAQILSQPDDVVERLAAESYTPEKLVKPFDGHYQNPDLHIIPESEEIPLAPLLAERDRLFVQISTVWRSDRAKIVGQLDGARLNQQSYKPSQIADAASACDNWIGRGNAAAANSKLELFSQQKITSKLTKSSPSTPDHPFFSLCQQMLEVHNSLEQAFQHQIFSRQRELKGWLESELSRRKKLLNQRAFDDLLLDLHLALEAESGTALAEKLRQRYQAALIDEFQDTDPLQWNIFRRIGERSAYPLFLIGDPKQAIYSFRGADVFAYLAAGKRVAPANQHTLGTNFRSDAALIKGLATLFAPEADPFMSEQIRALPVAAGRSVDDRLLVDAVQDTHPLKLWIYSRDDLAKAELKPAATRRIVQSVANEITRLLEADRITLTTAKLSHPLQPGDIAVLVKTHKQADRIQEALRSRGVPSVQLGSSTIFETAEALDLLKVLRATAEPHHEARVREALLTAVMGMNASFIYRSVESGGEHADWETWLLRFQDLHTAAISGGVTALVSRLLGSCGVRERLLSQHGGERCLTNILHCSELLHQVEREQGKSLSGLITWLERRIASPAKEDAALLRLETDENAVIISTIHASKGLQYPVVFIPFAWDVPTGKTDRALFHDDAGTLVLDLAGEKENLQRSAAERRSEAMRLLYVALTRAEFRCYAVWGAINGAIDSPLFRLLHGGAEPLDSKSFSMRTDQEILDDVSKFTGGAESGIAVQMMNQDEPAAGYLMSADAHSVNTCRTLASPPRDDWRIASFSSMTSKTTHAFEAHDHDSSAIAISPSDDSLSGELTIFNFPRGTKAGTCLHDIFERLDFSATSADTADTTLSIVRTSLQSNGFDTEWEPCVSRMIANIAAARIIEGDPDFTLSHLQVGEWLPEMEFYLPIRKLAPDTLQSLFDGILDSSKFGDYFEVLKKLSFRQSRGMLQGFIDLVFIRNGRYYIIDWKSNHLGMKTSDYHQGALKESMCGSAYILQYHLYALALDRLLRQRLPGYRYETHFGGAIYLYVRGISGGDANHGIYFDRPSQEFIRRAAEMMLA
jgi:exodeoxyribonuclease V beta subunit